MKVLIPLSHPAHYHMLKNFISLVVADGGSVNILAKKRDELINLLVEDNVVFRILKIPKVNKNSKFKIFLSGLLVIIFEFFRIGKLCITERPDIMIGTNGTITTIGKILQIPSIVMTDDDYKINRLFGLLSFRFAAKIFAPEVTDLGPYANKKVGYKGFQKLLYLHPNYLKIDEDFFNSTGLKDQRLYIIRVVNLTASHDLESGAKGFDEQILVKLVDLLESEGKVLISSEKKLPKALEKNRYCYPLSQLHTILSHTDLFISDSQSMTLEAALLGVPNIRFSAFHRKISVLDYLEDSFGLTFSFDSNDQNGLFVKLMEILQDSNFNENFRVKKEKMMKGMPDVNRLLFQTALNLTKGE